MTGKPSKHHAVVMKLRIVARSVLIYLLLLAFVACRTSQDHAAEGQAERATTHHAQSRVDGEVRLGAAFTHHYIDSELLRGAGPSALADFTNDGRLDFAVGVRSDRIYWYQNNPDSSWERHVLGDIQGQHIGSAAYDVDGDGWVDLIVGPAWYRNPGQPGQVWPRHVFDDSFEGDVHDLVVADVTGDGRSEIVLMGHQGFFWYQISDDPTTRWLRFEIAEPAHGGFAPAGIGDLNGDGLNDIALPKRWLENLGGGLAWREHPLPFGSEGPWGASARSIIVDINGNGHQDVVMVDADRQDAVAAWLENVGGRGLSWRRHDLPQVSTGRRGSFHSLAVADFSGNGYADIFTAEQEDLLPDGVRPRWFIWENLHGKGHVWCEHVVLDAGLGAHEAWVGDISGNGAVDIIAKVWQPWPGNANQGRAHVSMLRNEKAMSRPRILVFTQTLGFRHPSIPAGIQAVQGLAERYNFHVDVSEDADLFSDESLSCYDAVAFLNTTGNILSLEQRAAFERFIQSGKGFVGIHSAADTGYDWPWYGGLVGAYFKSHPPVQRATLVVEDHEHISTRHYPERFAFTDEWYEFDRNPRDYVNVLMTVDEATYTPADPMGEDHPVAWYHEYDGGRAWYTNLGHETSTFSDEGFLLHLLGGIHYAVGVTP